MKTPFLRVVFSIIRKDLQAEFRSRELINSMILFALLSTLVFSFALELNRTAEKEVVSGVLWVTIIFASILGLNRSLSNEREQGSMDAMLLAPIDRTAIYAGKMFGNFLFTSIVGLILILIMTILFNITLSQPLMILSLFLGVLGITSIGTLIAAMTVQTRTSETLLPLALLPVTLPVVMIMVRASASIIEDGSSTGWLIPLLVVDTIYVVLGFMLFDYVVED